jgi:hypothetical protein
MNQSVGMILALIFLVAVTLHHFMYAILNFNSRKIKKRWIWLRLVLSVLLLLGTGVFIYVFFLSQ